VLGVQPCDPDLLVSREPGGQLETLVLELDLLVDHPLRGVLGRVVVAVVGAAICCDQRDGERHAAAEGRSDHDVLHGLQPTDHERWRATVRISAACERREP
jgi:hypothetical protein